MLQYSVLDNKNIFKSKNLDEYLYNLLDQTFQIPSDGYNYQVFEVSENYIARPDLISYDAYGSNQYTDIICKLNGISNPFELNEGQLLILPTLESIISKPFTFKTPTEELENIDDEVIVPTQKTKQEKRKSNESIIGDSRFRIDSSSNIIIY